jgi:hypothetical protein
LGFSENALLRRTGSSQSRPSGIVAEIVRSNEQDLSRDERHR